MVVKVVGLMGRPRSRFQSSIFSKETEWYESVSAELNGGIITIRGLKKK
jgi:hypothetical protein